MNFKIDLTPKAIEKAKEELIKRNTPDSAIRLGLTGGSCSGYSYVFQFDDDASREGDHIFNFDGLKIYIDKKSIIYLNGITLDWEFNLQCQGFKFINPNIRSQCGCGRSFSV